MTLAQRYRLANLALRVFMALGLLIGLAALWHWAYRFGELAFLHAGLQGRPLSGGSVRAFGYLLSMGVMGAFFAAIQGERIAVRLVALASDGAGMPRTRAEYGEGAEPTSLPVTRTWKTEVSPSVLVATLVVAPSGVALSQASDMYKADPFIFWLIVSIAFVVIIIGASVFVLSLARGGRRGQVEGLVVDERGIRRWTSSGDEVTLAWSDVRLLEVTRLTPNQRDSSLTYRIYDQQGYEVMWRQIKPFTSAYLTSRARASTLTDMAESMANTEMLVWLARTHSGLPWRTDQPQLVEAAGPIAQNGLGQDIVAPLFALLASLLPALLALGILQFHGALFPTLNIAAALGLALYTVSLFARSGWRVLDYQRTWVARARGAHRDAPSRSTLWAVVEPSLAFAGGALGVVVCFTALITGSVPTWIPGDVIVLVGTPVLAAVGAYLTQRAWRRWRDGQRRAADETRE